MELITPLCKLAYKYGTDKCLQIKHSYTPFYYQLLSNKRKSIKKVLELGIGKTRKNTHQPEVIYEHGVVPYLMRGASLYMWRDFFPNAQIYGADDSPETLFEDTRIQTFFCDETIKEDILKLIKKTGPDIDLFIDDGNHNRRRQIFLCKTSMPLLKKDVIYIIEDVRYPDEIVSALSEYDCQISQFPARFIDDRVIVVRNKT
jgi:hypothetical protein